MEELFLFHLEVCAFSMSIFIEDTWQLQVKNMYRNWPKLLNHIDTKVLMDKFIRDCDKHNLCWRDFDVIGCFLKVQAFWRQEIALRVANRIAQLFTDGVFFENTRIVSFNDATEDIELKDAELFMDVDQDLYRALL